jgi:hypothetical protein
MHPRYTPLQNWERTALYDHAQQNKDFRAASPVACFALTLQQRDICANVLLTPSSPIRNSRSAIICAIPPPANLDLEIRLYALFAE